jgi:D-glycerate 3-kinase
MTPPVHPHPPKAYDEPLVQSLLQLAMSLSGRTPVLGLAGVQGTGKSTLAGQLVRAAQAQGRNAVAMSIDDVYLTLAERQRLAREVHPLLATRGPPGTHDVKMGCDHIDALRALAPDAELGLPEFDKIADDRRPGETWHRCRGPVDLVVLEGWFLKTPPEPAAALEEPINTLERVRDADGRWRRWCNNALASYAPLWSRIDHLVFLQPPGFEVVRQWRWQQELDLQARHPERRAMDHPQVMDFIAYFERVSRQALRTLPVLADTVIGIDAERRPRWPPQSSSAP